MTTTGTTQDKKGDYATNIYRYMHTYGTIRQVSEKQLIFGFSLWKTSALHLGNSEGREKYGNGVFPVYLSI